MTRPIEWLSKPVDEACVGGHLTGKGQRTAAGSVATIAEEQPLFIPINEESIKNVALLLSGYGRI